MNEKYREIVEFIREYLKKHEFSRPSTIAKEFLGMDRVEWKLGSTYNKTVATITGYFALLSRISCIKKYNGSMWRSCSKAIDELTELLGGKKYPTFKTHGKEKMDLHATLDRIEDSITHISFMDISSKEVECQFRDLWEGEIRVD